MWWATRPRRWSWSWAWRAPATWCWCCRWVASTSWRCAWSKRWSRRVPGVDWLDDVAGVRPGEPLSRHSQFGVGGPAQWFIKTSDGDLLATLLARCHEAGVAVTMLGAGSNALIAD